MEGEKKEAERTEGTDDQRWLAMYLTQETPPRMRDVVWLMLQVTGPPPQPPPLVRPRSVRSIPEVPSLIPQSKHGSPERAERDRQADRAQSTEAEVGFGHGDIILFRRLTPNINGR